MSNSINVDINLSQLNVPGSGLQGTDNSRFIFTFNNAIRASKVRLVNMRYMNQIIGATVLPILNCSIVRPTLINNDSATILFISELPLNNTDYVIRNETNNSVYIYDIINTGDNIRSINFEIQRSDNGQTIDLSNLRFFLEFIQ
jgi:hypothetical protein